MVHFAAQNPHRAPEKPVLAGDRLCGACMAANPIWFTDSPLWNRVVGGPRAKGDPGGVLCPACFMARADHALGEQVWTVLPHDDSVESPTLDALRAARAYIGNPARSGLARDRHRDSIIDKIDAAILRASSAVAAVNTDKQVGTDGEAGSAPKTPYRKA